MCLKLWISETSWGWNQTSGSKHKIFFCPFVYKLKNEKGATSWVTWTLWLDLQEAMSQEMQSSGWGCISVTVTWLLTISALKGLIKKLKAFCYYWTQTRRRQQYSNLSFRPGPTVFRSALWDRVPAWGQGGQTSGETWESILLKATFPFWIQVRPPQVCSGLSQTSTHRSETILRCDFPVCFPRAELLWRQK